jgi:hypothetical protein
MRFDATRTAICAVAVVVVGIPVCFAQGATKSSTSENILFAPLQQWRSAILSGDAIGLRALYSGDPAAQIEIPSGKVGVDNDVAFWTGLRPHRLSLKIVQLDTSKAGMEQIVFQAEIHSSAPSAQKTVYITEGQLWQQEGGQWRLVASKRTDPARLQQPATLEKEIYEPGVDARAAIKQALALATQGNKRVLVVFGANWCYDCHVLDLAFHRPDLASILDRKYEVVHVDVGRGDKNQDLMQEYDVPMKRGIPALAVLDADGKLLFSQKNGEFENARALGPEDLLEFLNQWKPRER